MFGFHKKYFLATLLLFAVEICIALFVRDRFVRPYLGDMLVVILLYCFVRSFVKFNPIIVATGVLGFAILIETLQYFSAIEHLQLQENRIARTVLGSSFDWMDVLVYFAGIVLILIVEIKGSITPEGQPNS